MITKDYQGNTLPVGYSATVQGDSRAWLAKLEYTDGTEIECGIKQFEISKGSCGTSTEFTIGNIISSTLNAEVLDLTDDIKGEYVNVLIGLVVGGTYKWINIGTFNISEVKKTIYSTTIIGHGRLVAESGNGFPDLTTPTLAQLAYYIGVELGCTVTLDTSIDSSLTITEPLVGLTTYQALQILVNTVGGYAIETNDGVGVKVCLYDDTPTLSVDSSLMASLPDVEEKDFSITGVRVTVSVESNDSEGTIPAVGYESSTAINLLCTNKYMTQALFNDMESNLVGYTYRPASINLTLGDPRIEGNDVLTVTDADGSVYVVPCHMVKHIYTGGLQTEIEAVRATNSADGIGTLSPMQRALDNLNSGVVSAKSEASKAYAIAGNTNQYFWFKGTGTDTGAHITEVPQDDWDNPSSQGYHSGGNLLARSNGIAVRQGLTELATFGASLIRVGQSNSSHVELGSDNGMNVFDQDNKLRLNASSTGVSIFDYDSNNNRINVANFGTTARIGAVGSSRFLINSGSLQAYDNNNSKYFEVSANGMTYGSHTVADTAYADQAEADAISTASADATAKANEAKKVATNYIFDIDSNKGIQVKPSDSSGNDYLQMNSNAIAFLRNGNTCMALTDDTFRMGLLNSGHSTVTSSGLEVYGSDGSTSIASFGSSARIGASGSARVEIGSTNGMNVFDANSNIRANFSNTGVSIFDTDGTNIAQIGGSTSGAGARIGASSAPNVTTTSTGVTVKQNSNNYATVTSSGLDVVQGGSSVASFGSSARIGASGSARAEIGSANGMNIFDTDGNIRANFSSTGVSIFDTDGTNITQIGSGTAGAGVRIGDVDDYNIYVNDTGVAFREGLTSRFKITSSTDNGLTTSELSSISAYSKAGISTRVRSESGTTNSSQVYLEAVAPDGTTSPKSTVSALRTSTYAEIDIISEYSSTKRAGISTRAGSDSSVSSVGINADEIRVNGDLYLEGVYKCGTGGNKILTIDTVTVDNISISANGSATDQSVSATKSSYTPIGVVGYVIANATSSGTGGGNCVLTQARIVNSNAVFSIKNVSSSAVKVRVIANILYISSTQGV